MHHRKHGVHVTAAGCNGETQGSLASRLAMASTASLASALRRYGFVRGSAGGPMGLTILVLGLALFFAAPVFVTLRTPRAAVIKRIGEGPYKGLMSLVSLAGLILIGYGFGQYRATGWINVWSPPAWTYYVTQIWMWPASISVVAA